MVLASETVDFDADVDAAADAAAAAAAELRARDEAWGEPSSALTRDMSWADIHAALTNAGRAPHAARRFCARRGSKSKTPTNRRTNETRTNESGEARERSVVHNTRAEYCRVECKSRLHLVVENRLSLLLRMSLPMKWRLPKAAAASPRWVRSP